MTQSPHPKSHWLDSPVWLKVSGKPRKASLIHLFRVWGSGLQPFKAGLLIQGLAQIVAFFIFLLFSDFGKPYVT